ncbi:MAG: diguanylate cyclase [Pseudomonadota bacterium]
MNTVKQTLDASQKSLESLIESIIDPVVVTDNKGVIDYFNEEAERFLGWKRKEIVGKHESVYYKGGRQETKKIMRVLEKDGKVRDYEITLVSNDGREIPSLLSASFLKDSEGKAIGTVVVLRGGSEKKTVKNDIMESVEHVGTLLDNANDLVCILEVDGTFAYVNQKITEMGYVRDELLGSSFFSVLSQSHRGPMFKEALLGGRKQTHEIAMEDRQGNVWDTLLSVSPLFDRDGEMSGFLVLGRDITDRKELERELEKLSITDSLTGLYNQRHFYGEIGREIERAKRLGRPLSLILFDVDGFKSYNDTYGHLEGDKILQKVGRVVSQNIRGNVDSGYRYGGDEFMIILPEARKNQALTVGERIRKSFKDSEAFYVALSMGLVEYRNEYDLEKFIRLADEAMYTAKHLGGDRMSIYE